MDVDKLDPPRFDPDRAVLCECSEGRHDVCPGRTEQLRCTCQCHSDEPSQGPS